MSERRERIDPAAVALALSALALQGARSVTGRSLSALEPLSRVVLDPPWLPDRLRPGTWLGTLNRSGERHATAIRAELTRRLDEIVPLVLAEVVRRADLTDLIVRHVDVDRVIAAADLDAAAARLDVTSVVDRVDLDAAVLRLDLDAAVDRVDLDAVIERLDVDAVLDRLDLTAVVLERVDLAVVVAAVLDRIDLIGLANEVIEGVDLPQIIRESTGSMASETVHGARMQSIAADEAVSRVVDRLLLRRRDRAVLAPTLPDSTRPAPGPVQNGSDPSGPALPARDPAAPEPAAPEPATTVPLTRGEP